MTWTAYTHLLTDKQRSILLTYNAEWLSSESQPPLPSSVPAATACGPEPHQVLHPKHDNHHKLLLEDGIKQSGS